MMTNSDSRVAVYTGSFDPVTLGHLNVIERSSRLVDRLIVGIGTNIEKQALFSPEERVDLVRLCTERLGNVDVQAFSGLAVNFVRQCGARVMLRGVRSLGDIEAEFTMTLANRKLDPGIETVFLMADDQFSHISSSLIKQIAALASDDELARFVPREIVPAIRRSMRDSRSAHEPRQLRVRRDRGRCGARGHRGGAGCRPAGRRTALLTTNCDTVGQMSCNPAIGGVAKGQIVREIDALGGAMGQAIDATGIQFRLLNRRKGPAMHSPRAQADKKAYQQWIKQFVEEQPGLVLKQEVVEDLLVKEPAPGSDAPPRIDGVRVRGDAVYRAPAVVLTTGTFLQALMHTGETKTPGGRAGEGTTAGISGSLQRLGFELARFKTGTPPRLNSRTIDYSKLELQPGDNEPQPFSFLTERLDCQQLPCWITFTNEAAHEVIRANLHRAPMYSGQIRAGGPRYCPSIEDKVVRFADKDRHQLFLEPEGARPARSTSTASRPACRATCRSR